MTGKKNLATLFYSHDGLKCYLTTNGYVKILPSDKEDLNKNYVREHRWRVEIKIGRPLKNKEEVHHLDLNKQNNRISNLMLFPSGKKHSAWHNLVKKFPYLTNPMKRQIENRWEGFK